MFVIIFKISIWRRKYIISLNIEDKGKAKIVMLEGKLDVNLSVSLESELDALIDSGSNNLILEISKVEYLSSSGIRVFINMMRKVKDKNGRLVLASVPASIKKTGWHATCFYIEWKPKPKGQGER